MGLDAVVYRGGRHLGFGPDQAKNNALDETVIHKRLGNASSIAELSEVVACLIGRDSVLYKNVLYSGSHSGDAVSTDQFDSLESEILKIEGAALNPTDAVKTFLQDIRELLVAAREQNSPIVFV